MFIPSGGRSRSPSSFCSCGSNPSPSASPRLKRSFNPDTAPVEAKALSYSTKLSTTQRPRLYVLSGLRLNLNSCHLASVPVSTLTLALYHSRSKPSPSYNSSPSPHASRILKPRPQYTYTPKPEIKPSHPSEPRPLRQPWPRSEPQLFPRPKSQS